MVCQELCKITLLTGINSALRQATSLWAEGTTPASTGVVGVWMVRVGGLTANGGTIASDFLAWPMSWKPA